MVRPLRIEYPGAVHHITSRGNARQDIFLDDADRQSFLDVFASAVAKYNWVCHAYCLMDNHYHLLVETPDPNLALGMRQVNGVYTQRFNYRHGLGGHVFQGRYKSILVEKSAYLLELCRYLVLNPVRTDMVKEPKEWPWSSYKATAYAVRGPEFLTVDWVLDYFGSGRKEARSAYRKFVREGMAEEAKRPWEKLVGQIIFGGPEFAKAMQKRILESRELGEIPRKQRFAGRPPLQKLFSRKFLQDKVSRNARVELAHVKYGYTLKEIADQLGIHYTTVSKIVKSQKIQ